MKKLSVFVPALALVAMMSASALAENGAISSAQLNEMGLGSIATMSDSAAMAVRGRGYQGFGSASAYGDSRSEIDFDFNLGPFGNIEFDTKTEDGFEALGQFKAGGLHVSQSSFSTSISDSTDVPGVGSVIRTISFSVNIGSGGSASAFSL